LRKDTRLSPLSNTAGDRKLGGALERDYKCENDVLTTTRSSSTTHRVQRLFTAHMGCCLLHRSHFTHVHT